MSYRAGIGTRREVASLDDGIHGRHQIRTFRYPQKRRIVPHSEIDIGAICAHAREIAAYQLKLVHIRAAAVPGRPDPARR